MAERNFHLQIWDLIHQSSADADLEEAVRRLEKHLGTSPKDVDALCLLSEAHLALGQADEALEAALEAAKHADSNDAEPYFRAGLAFFDLSTAYEEGAQSEQRFDPGLHFVELTLGIPLVRRTSLAEEALRMFQRARTRSGSSSGAHFWSGVCLMNLGGKAQEALEAFQIASELVEGEEALADCWFFQGLIFEELERQKEAKEAYQIALAHQKDHRASLIRLEWLDAGKRDLFLSPQQVDALCRLLERGLAAELRQGGGADFAHGSDKNRKNQNLQQLSQDLSRACSSTLKFSKTWASKQNLDPERLESFLYYHGAGCDCEVLLNLEARLGLRRE